MTMLDFYCHIAWNLYISRYKARLTNYLLLQNYLFVNRFEMKEIYINTAVVMLDFEFVHYAPTYFLCV